MKFSTFRLVLTLLLTTASFPAALDAAEPGDLVIFFKSRDILGQPLSLGELVARHRVAVFFWDWRRATSTRAMKALDRMQQRYGQDGFEVVAVEGEGSTLAQVLDRVEKLRSIGIEQRYRIVPDPGGRIARQFRVENTPQIFLLDGSGRVSFHLEGFQEEDEPVLEGWVRAGLGNEAPVTEASPPAAARASAPEPAPPEPPPVEDPKVALVEKYRYFGSYHLNRDEPATAEDYFRRIVEIAPDDTSAWLHIGESCARQRRYDQAREAWDQVLKLEPGNREADANIRRLIRGEY